jgi:hypothetical protein
LNTFHNSLRGIASFHSLHARERKAREYRSKLRALESAKEKLVESMGNILSKTGILDDFEREKNPSGTRWTTEQRNNALIEEFRLNRAFVRIDERIRRTKKIIFLYEDLKMPYQEILKRIQPMNLVILVWQRAMLPNIKDNLKDIKTLLSWLSNENGEEIISQFGRIFITTEKNVSTVINRYNNDKYFDVIEILYAESFSDFYQDA